MPNHVLTDINRLLFRFLCQKKDCNRKAFEKVKRIVMCNNSGNGGLKMIDLKLMQVYFCWTGWLGYAKHKTGGNRPGLPKYYVCFLGPGMNVFIPT